MKMRALIVDDEPMQIQGLVRHIDWKGLRYEPPLAAQSAEQALELLASHEVDVLITDVSMPEMTGIELLAKCRSDLPHLYAMQTVMISGYDEFEFVQEAIHLGAKAYVLKPIKTEELEEKLATFRDSAEKKNQIEQETNKLKEKMMESYEVLQEHFVKELSEGSIQSRELLDSWGRLLDFPEDNWDSTLFLFSVDRSSHPDSNDAKERIMLNEGLIKCVKIGLSEFEGAYIGRTGADEAAVLLISASPSDRAKLEKRLSFIQDVVKEQYNASVTVGISRESRSWSEVPERYKEVKHMIANARRASGSGQVLHFDHAEMNEYDDFRLGEEFLPEIISLLDKGQSERAVERFNDTFDMLMSRQASSWSYVQAFSMGLISELVWKLKRGRDGDAETNISMWQRLIDCTEAEDIRAVVLEYLEQYARSNQKEQTAQQHNLIQKVSRHLEEHVQDNVTVKQLAEQFHMNSSYLSVLFKKEMGRTISDFVQEIRMNKAKDLLRDPNIKVYEVAEQVGFQTAAYFAFLFKKLTGTTPQEYRDYYYKE